MKKASSSPLSPPRRKEPYEFRMIEKESTDMKWTVKPSNDQKQVGE